MSVTLATSPDLGKLRPLLHAVLDRLSDEHLDLAHRALLEIEMHQLTGELDDAADPDDNKFADCAITAGADYIITEDRHFAPLATAGYHPQPITPVEFIAKQL